MKDIGDLETRLEHVEYYTSLSLLEVQAENTKTYDDNGFDRLKNGYVVDDFTDHNVGDALLTLITSAPLISRRVI